MKNKVAIVYSDYYKDVTSGLLDGFNNSIDSTFEIITGTQLNSILSGNDPDNDPLTFSITNFC